jgi:hypothetical protein
MSLIRPNVEAFRRLVESNGFAKKYNFQVENIDGLPEEIPDYDPYSLYISSASIPSRKINTTRLPYKAFEFVVPTNAVYPDNQSWRIQFISDSEMTIRNLFETWTRVLYDELNNTGKSNFAGATLTLNLISDEGKVTRKYKLYGVFPILMDSVEYNISDTGADAVKFNVTLAYQYFKTDVAT